MVHEESPSLSLGAISWARNSFSEVTINHWSIYSAHGVSYQKSLRPDCCAGPYNYRLLIILIVEKGESIPHADALSRLEFTSESPSSSVNSREEAIVHWTETNILSVKELQQETQHDRLLAGVLNRVVKNRWSGCSVAERPFKAVLRQSLSCEDGILCLVARIL